MSDNTEKVIDKSIDLIEKIGGSASNIFDIWGACMLCVAVFGFIKFQPLINVWNYVAVVKPEVYLVKQVVDVVKNKAELDKK